MIKSFGNWQRIDYKSILYLKAEDYYTMIYTQSDSFLVRSTLSQFESQLPEFFFFRCHRSYIVALEQIRSINSNRTIRLLNDQVIPFSQVKRNQLLTRFSFTAK
ncbi:MAG: LytTR family transcriptional regulator [Calditrichaeota bacterium]|nr:LytTR family transcriptional regulator [Calditrichota bacterium]